MKDKINVTMQRNCRDTASSAFFDINASLSSLNEVIYLNIRISRAILSTLKIEYGIGKKKPR